MLGVKPGIFVFFGFFSLTMPLSYSGSPEVVFLVVCDPSMNEL